MSKRVKKCLAHSLFKLEVILRKQQDTPSNNFPTPSNFTVSNF